MEAETLVNTMHYSLPKVEAETLVDTLSDMDPKASAKTLAKRVAEGKADTDGCDSRFSSLNAGRLAKTRGRDTYRDTSRSVGRGTARRTGIHPRRD